MDAISFVLGIKSAVLRSSQLKDLVYRGRRLENDQGVDAMDVDVDINMDETRGEKEELDNPNDAKRAWVLAVYEDDDKKEWHFQRTSVSILSRGFDILCSY